MRLLALNPIGGIAVIALLSLFVKTSRGQVTETNNLGIFQDDTGEQCPILGCCEYDCCGKGTSWNESIGYCVEDPDSSGFDSSFPPSFENGCVDRVCCDENCCQDGLLVFDPSTSFCVPDTCGDKEFVLTISYSGDRTMSSADVQDMYECCNRGNEVMLDRIWESAPPEVDNEGYDSVQLCPENGVTLEGNVYTFTLNDDRIVMFTCDDDEGQCEVSGNGLENDTGGYCHEKEDCISRACHLGDYLSGFGRCECNDTYGCEPNQVCLECLEFYEQSFGVTSRPEECDRPNANVQHKCYLKLGEACQEFGNVRCETGFCENGICVCSPATDYPCDTETELCIDSTCQTLDVPARCSDKEFVLFVPLNGDRTMSSDDIQDMYRCCNRGNEVILNRIWESTSAEMQDEEDSIQLCPGFDVFFELNSYIFALNDGRIVVFTCENDDGQCEVSGDGLESDTGGNCQNGDDCISGVCYRGDYIRECVCSDTYGCEPSQVCLECSKFYKQSIGGYGASDECGDSDTTAQYACYLKMGEACQEFGDIQCETSFCEDGICVCSPLTDFPCDEETERCTDSSCQTIPDGCRNEPFDLVVPYVYGQENRTMSSDDVQDMYDCCNNGGDVNMRRVCDHYFGSSETIGICPGNGASKDGNVYAFTLSDDRVVTFSCNDEGVCVATGDESDSGEDCCANSDCISGSCHLGEYIGGKCTCSEDYGCEENEICIDVCDEDVGNAEDCDRSNHVVRFQCWPL